MGPPNDIVFFHYSFSPYARRVTWYLALRGIEYAQCMQPVTLPREDLSALGVKYRRIPVMAIGRDIYCDTRLILQKLEEKFPSGALGASQADQKAIEKLLEKWTIDSGVFVRAAQTLPPEMPLLNDSKFTKDREEYTGRSWAKEDITRNRPEALAHLREAFDLLETGLLADGRQWVLKTEKPSLADIEAVWPFHWLAGIKGALPPKIISAKQYPKVFAYIDRFQKAVSAAKSSAPKPTTLKGVDAVAQINKAEFSEQEGQVDENDPLDLKKGQDVEVWPIDSGFRNHDQGKLSALTTKEVIVTGQTKTNKEIRIHFPRTNFRIMAVQQEGQSKL